MFGISPCLSRHGCLIPFLSNVYLKNDSICITWKFAFKAFVLLIIDHVFAVLWLPIQEHKILQIQTLSTVKILFWFFNYNSVFKKKRPAKQKFVVPKELFCIPIPRSMPTIARILTFTLTTGSSRNLERKGVAYI